MLLAGSTRLLPFREPFAPLPFSLSRFTFLGARSNENCSGWRERVASKKRESKPWRRGSLRITRFFLFKFCCWKNFQQRTRWSLRGNAALYFYSFTHTRSMSKKGKKSLHCRPRSRFVYYLSNIL